MLIAAAGTTLHTIEEMPDTAVFTFKDEDTVLFKRAYGESVPTSSIYVVCIAARNMSRIAEILRVSGQDKLFVPQIVRYTEDGLVLEPCSYK